MPDDTVIRDLEPGEVEAAVEIALAAWAPIYASFRRIMGEELFEAAFPDWRAQKAGGVRDACSAARPAIVCAAERKGRIVGFITAYPNDHSGIAEIGNNAVHPDFQGQEIGTAMYRHVLIRLKDLGMRFAKVLTGGDPAHAPARRAYQKAGFAIQVPAVTYYRRL